MTQEFEDIKVQFDRDDLSFAELEAFVEARMDALTEEERESVADWMHMAAMTAPESGYGRD
jgi:hypothetical protein